MRLDFFLNSNHKYKVFVTRFAAKWHQDDHNYYIIIILTLTKIKTFCKTWFNRPNCIFNFPRNVLLSLTYQTSSTLLALSHTDMLAYPCSIIKGIIFVPTTTVDFADRSSGSRSIDIHIILLGVLTVGQTWIFCRYRKNKKSLEIKSGSGITKMRGFEINSVFMILRLYHPLKHIYKKRDTVFFRISRDSALCIYIYFYVNTRVYVIYSKKRILIFKSESIERLER